MKKILLVILLVPFFFACKQTTTSGNRPVETVCGNGIAEEGENSQNCPADCPPESTMGNGVVDGDEECDDMNNVSGDGCSSDGKVESGYNCPPEGGMCVSE